MNKKNLQTLELLVKEQKKVNQLMNEQNMARLNIKHALKDIITPKEGIKALDLTRLETAKNIKNLKKQHYALKTRCHNQLLNALKPTTVPSTPVPAVSIDIEPLPILINQFYFLTLMVNQYMNQHLNLLKNKIKELKKIK